ncbi:MAG: hypothetical protein V4682_00905 [Patescibacteria group bacterium]
MKRLLVTAFAVLALFGCDKAPEEKSASPVARPIAAETVSERPAPQPVAEIIVTNAEINAGKNEWVAAQAAQHNISIAEVERRARFMRATPDMQVTVCGRTVAFTKTIWHSCEAAIKASRVAQVAAPVRDADTVTLTRQQYNQLRDDAYENPEETDPTKLRSYREKAGRLEVQVDNLDGVNLSHWTMLFGGLIAGAILFRVVFRRKKDSPQKKDLPREDPRPATAEAATSPPSTPGDFTG